MSFWDKLRGAASKAARNMNGDPTFLAAAAASVATVTYADGTAEESEKDAAAKSLTSNGTIARSYDHVTVQRAIDAAMERATTRAGKMENLRSLQKISSRSQPEREDVLLMGADVADVDKKEGGAAHGIGKDEMRALEQIAKELGLKLADYGIELAA